MTLTTRCPSCGITHAVPEADALEQGAARDRRTIEAQQAELERLRAEAAEKQLRGRTFDTPLEIPWAGLVRMERLAWAQWMQTHAVTDLDLRAAQRWIDANAPQETPHA